MTECERIIAADHITDVNPISCLILQRKSSEQTLKRVLDVTICRQDDEIHETCVQERM